MIYIGIIIILSALLIDQVTKIIAKRTLTSDDKKLVFNIRLIYLENSGFAMGRMSGNMLFIIMTSLFAIYISAFGFLFYDMINNPIYSIGISLFLGGSLGNMVDRVFRSYVIDFIYFDFKKFNSPVFNIADFEILIGLLLVCVGFIINLF